MLVYLARHPNSSMMNLGLHRPLQYWSVLLTLGLVCWGASFLLIRVALYQLSPEELVALRLTVATATLIIALLASSQPWRISKEHAIRLTIVGMLNTALPFAAVAIAENTVPSGIVGAVSGFTPIATTILVIVTSRGSRTSVRNLVAIGVGFVGVMLLLDGFRIDQITSTASSAYLLTLVVPVSYALGALLSRRWLQTLTPLLVATWSVGASTLYAWLFVFLSSAPLTMPTDLLTLSVVVWLGMISTALAYLLYFHLIHNWGAERASFVAYVFPIAAPVFGTMVLGEPFRLATALGVALVLYAVWLPTNRNFASSRTTRSY